MPHEPKVYQKEKITVDFMADQLRHAVGIEFEAVNEADAASRHVTESNLHRPGMALMGYTEPFSHQRVQVLGNTETQYLEQQDPAGRRAAFQNVMDFEIPCLVLTGGNTLDAEILRMATDNGVPVFRTPLPITRFMSALRDFLADQFALQQTVHGSLVDVYGIGLLLIGEPGIGKSEVALDLVERGQRLVADDVVVVTRKEERVLMGSGTDLVQHFMEVRGLGLVDVRAMFGIRAIRFQKRVEMVVHMHPWDPDEEYTRLGMVEDSYELLGTELPIVKVPITPGKNITVICEVIAMNYLLRHYGYDPAEVFAQRLSDQIERKGPDEAPTRGTEYFEHDYE